MVIAVSFAVRIIVVPARAGMSLLFPTERHRERRVSLCGLAMKPLFVVGSWQAVCGGDAATPASLESIATVRPDTSPRVSFYAQAAM
jgi:hypothetical protein